MMLLGERVLSRDATRVRVCVRTHVDPELRPTGRSDPPDRFWL